MAAAVAVAATADSRVSFPPLFYILHLFFSFYYLYSSIVRFSFYPSLSFVVSSLDFLPRPITLPSLCCTSAQCLEGTHRAFCFLRAAPRADPAKRGSSIRLPVNILASVQVESHFYASCNTEPSSLLRPPARLLRRHIYAKATIYCIYASVSWEGNMCKRSI